MNIDIFEEMESSVRSYCRSFPQIFDYAENAILESENKVKYIDFFAGAGALNYGHNNPFIKNQIMEYLSENRIIHALDMYTSEKKEFLKTLKQYILEPKNLDYKVMFCGSTGTNAVEAALKLARKNTKRTNIIAFSGAFHGMTLGSLALTTDHKSRNGAGVPLTNVSFAPYCSEFEQETESIKYLQWMLDDDHSGIERPAAIVLETVQAEGGVNVASTWWLQQVRLLCDKFGILLVVDDIQVGNCRTGSFFSWERAGIVPDIVVLSKSISGFGLPMSLLLIKPEYDIFKPAEHNGTWRGNQLAFVGASAALEYYQANNLPNMVKEKEKIIRDFLENEIVALDNRIIIRGIGMIWGIDFSEIDSSISQTVMKYCFTDHLVIERAGRNDTVLKILPPLTIPQEVLVNGLLIIKRSIEKAIKTRVE